MPGWIMQHREITPNPGTKIGHCSPWNLQWGLALDGSAYVNYEIPLTDPLARELLVKPRRTDYALQTRGGGPIVTSGFHTELSMDSIGTNRMLKVAGKGYLSYLDNIIWPKDPNSNYRTTTLADPTNGTVFDYSGSVSYVVYRLITEATALADSLTFTFSSIPASGGTAVRYRIEPGDTRTIAQHISDIFALGDPAVKYYLRLVAGGDPLRTIQMTSGVLPSFGTSTAITYKFRSGLSTPANCEIISFKYGGIRGTRLLALAQGPNHRKAVIDVGNTGWYRRWDIVEEFGGPSGFANLTTLAASTMDEAQVPDIEIQIKYYDEPEIFNPYINDLVYPGARVGLTAELEWIYLSDTFTVTSVDCTASDGISTEYIATLNQPFSTS